MKQSILQKTYTYCISIALIFHVFNNIEIGGALKAFHVPALLAFILCFFIPKQSDKIHKITWGFIMISLFSSFISPWDGAIMHAVTFLIVLGSTIGLRYVDSRLLILSVNIGAPFAILSLVGHYFTDVWYRYSGFYEDPNYLSTTLIVFLLFILMGFKRWDSFYIRVALLIEVILILFLVTTTISRTGLLCIGIVLIVSFWDFFRKNKTQSIMALLAVLFLLMYYMPDLVNAAISGYMIREDNVDTIQSASSLRQEISLRGINYVLSHPLYLLQGIGLYAAGHHECFEGFIAHSVHIDHNTLTSSFTEQGLIGFLLFTNLLFNTFKHLWYNDDSKKERTLLLSVFVSIFLFSLSINDMLYLPYWFCMMYLSRVEVSSTKYFS